MKWALLLLAGCGTPAQQGDGGCASRAEQFLRVCATEFNCALLNHQVDCCGSEVVIGVSSISLTAAQNLERSCVAQGPLCRCAAKETLAEDGKTFPDGAALKLRCKAGRCESFVQ